MKPADFGLAAQSMALWEFPWNTTAIPKEPTAFYQYNVSYRCEGSLGLSTTAIPKEPM